MAYLRKKTVKDERYLYLVESLWDSKRKTSKQSIIKYLGKESSVTIDDIPVDYRDSEKITNYLKTQKYFAPKIHHDVITKTKNDLVLSLKEGDVIGAYSLYQNYCEKYGAREFLQKIFKSAILQTEKKFSDGVNEDLAIQAVIFKTAENLLSKILETTTSKTKSKKILICLPYGEQHSLGTKMIESELSLTGKTVYNLPPFSSTQEILDEINEKSPDCVFISVTLEENILSANRLKNKIQENYQKPIFVGGQAFNSKKNSEKNFVYEDRLEKICKLVNFKEDPSNTGLK